MIRIFHRSILILPFLSNILIGQITITNLPYNKDIISDTISGKNPNSIKRLLSAGWVIHNEKNGTSEIKTSVPFYYEGDKPLTLQREIILTKEEIEQYIFIIKFLCVNNNIEITLNKNLIFKKPGSGIPFEVELPIDILTYNEPNVLSLKIISKADSDNTIPVKQKFLFPKFPSGILREIFLVQLPKTNISDFDLEYTLDDKLLTANTKIRLKITGANLLPKALQQKEQYYWNIKVTPKNFSGIEINQTQKANIAYNDEDEENLQFTFVNPKLWSPELPNIYKITISLMAGNQVILKNEKDIAFLKFAFFQNKLSLNNFAFTLKGTSYYPKEFVLKDHTIYDQLMQDLTLIKQTGFNAVRFAKSLPHPSALEICEKLGLFALVELPINSIPEEILEQKYFLLVAENKFKEIIANYSKISSTVLFGLGSSYLANSELTNNFLSKLVLSVENKKHLKYASFLGIQKKLIEGVDLYGIEIYSNQPDNVNEAISESIAEEKATRFFFSEINYPVYSKNSNGYLTKNSSEAQAKFFENFINISDRNKLSGFFLGSIFDYKGEFASAYGGYSDSNIYSLGILREKPNLNSIVYKVISSKLQSKGKVTIPIGNNKEENKIMFIILALVLSILMAVLINIKKKFREDCTRALFRPYNFFADIRDHRIISGVHTFILMLIEAGSYALLFTILLYYLRTNILVEKILISFGIESFIKIFSYLAWNPEKSFLYLSLFFLLKIILLSSIIKLSSFFVKIKISSPNIFYGLVWAFLPFTLLLPAELILYKLLSITSFNSYIIISLLILFIWIFQRIIKSVHVIFDVKSFAVYFYGILIVLVISFGVLFYFQMTNSTIYFLTNSFKQYNLMQL
jgi:beta-galactosidase